MLLEQPVAVGQPLNQQVEKFDIKTSEVKSKDTALDLVIQDTQRAEKFIMARLWMSEWRVAKAIYEAPIKQEYWRDTLVPRASNSYPLCAQHVRAILDSTMPALFPEWPPFEIEPTEGTPRQVARAWEAALAFQIRQAGFKQTMRLIAKDALVFGTGIGKWGWETFERKRTVYQRKARPQVISTAVPEVPDTVVHTKESDELEAMDIDETVSRPFFTRCEINHTLVSPGLREPDIRKATYVIYRDYLTIRDLNRLRGFEGWEIPPEDELKRLAEPPAEQAPSAPQENEATAYPAQGHRPLPRYTDESADPLEHKLEVLEHWTPDRVIAVLQRKRVIRNEENKFHELPFVSCYWDDIPGTFYGFGIPRRIGSIQTHIQGLRNLRLDDVNLNLQNVWLEERGTNIAGQPIKLYPGARNKVDKIDGVKPLIKQPVLSEAYREEQVLVADAEKTTGANELLVQGSMPAAGRSSMGRTATGAGLMGGASSSRIQSFVDVVSEQVFIPTLYAFLHMDRELLEPDLLRKIVGKTLWEDLEKSHGGDLLVEMCNGAADIELSMQAGTSMGARRAMAAALPLEMQMYMAPAVQSGLADAGLKVNWVELSRRMEQASGWKSQDDVIVPISDEEKQARIMSDPEIVKGKVTAERIAQLHQQNKDLASQEHGQRLAEIDAKGLAGAGKDVITRALERAAVKANMDQIAGTFGG